MSSWNSSAADPSVHRLRRRDRLILLSYAGVTLTLIAGGEWAILTYGLSESLGLGPILFRIITYVTMTTLILYGLLSSNRRLAIHLLHEEEQRSEALIQVYEQAVHIRDPYTGGHGRRVARYSVMIAREIGLRGAILQEIEQAARLHDIGKIGWADAILRKPAPLTKEEFASVRCHPEAGAQLLESIPGLRFLAPAVRHHHERYDGTGYPQGLGGERIPLTARIIAVADALDALTTERPYHAAQPMDMAIAELRHEAGAAFDPAIVAVLYQSSLVGALLQRGSDSSDPSMMGQYPAPDRIS